jgi:Sec-independent protein translocase protein TatA|tara:strand:- start:38 stop:166 length:129 start_codon:yes stop_codon:yes gene_type:complete
MIGTTEIVLIVLGILILFGGKNVSKIAKKFAKNLNELRNFKI